jgi:hypothetical protein
MTRAVMLAAFLSISGCQSSDSAPPDYSPVGTGPVNPVTCDYLVGEAPPVDGMGHFAVDGGTAGCVSNGLECPIGSCDGGLARAFCFQEMWLYQCNAVHDGGNPDVGKTDAEAEDGAGDDGAEGDVSAQ